MAKINGCLRCLFIFFNAVFAVIGGLLIIGAVKASIVNQQLVAVGSPGVAWGWVLAIGILAISCLGIYAGCSEKQIALKVFAGFMGLGLIIMLICGIIVAVTRNKVRSELDSVSSDMVKTYMREEGVRELLDSIQETVQCCGVVSAEDWGDEIPASCACRSSGAGGYGYGFMRGSGCTSRPQGSSGPDQIYQQTCGDFIFTFFDLICKIAMGFFFGFAVTALLGLLVSLLMIHQVRRHDGEGGGAMAMKSY